MSSRRYRPGPENRDGGEQDAPGVIDRCPVSSPRCPPRPQESGEADEMQLPELTYRNVTRSHVHPGRWLR